MTKILKGYASNWKTLQLNRVYIAELIVMIPHEDKVLADLLNLSEYHNQGNVIVNSTMHVGLGKDAINHGKNLFPFTTFNN